MTGRFRLLAALLCLLGLLAGVVRVGRATAAEPGEVSVFHFRGCLSGGQDLAAAPKSGVLVRVCEDSKDESGNVLANLMPDGSLIEQRVPPSYAGLIVTGPAGEIWELGERLTRIAPDGSITTFPLPEAKKELQLERYDLVSDGQGGVWVAIGETAYGYAVARDSTGGELLHVSGAGSTTGFRVPEAVEPQSLTVGPDGNPWFTGIEGRAISEHSETPGTGYIGQMTPSGQFDLIRLPPETYAAGITAGPDGDLWFIRSEGYTESLGQIGVDGVFGPGIEPHYGGFSGPLAFGPEGDIWLPVGKPGLERLTPAGQETIYPNPIEAPHAVVVGPEGDIWSRIWKEARRVVPGGPGIDIWGLTADRAKHTVTVDLACGGSATGCAGTFAFELRKRKEDPRKPATEAGRFRILHANYTVAPESHRVLTLPIPAKTFRLAKREAPKRASDRSELRVIATATVTGGPTLVRKLSVPTGTPGDRQDTRSG